jgi:hypothetical protein
MGWHITSGPEVGRWVAAQIKGCSYHPDTAVTLGLWRDDGFAAGVLYEQWNGRSIVAHIAVTGRMTPAFVAAIFDYPFNVAKVEKIICPVYSDNPRSAALASHMGFRCEAKITDAAPDGGDIQLFTLAKKDCRFLEARYGKKCAVSTARA